MTLADVLAFFTGADREPPLGFPLTPKLQFLHGEDIFATASACELLLRLPTRHTSYHEFKESMIMSFCGHGGFGLI